MPEYCTCGTQLVEGSRFCHKCGRPTSGEAEIPTEVPRIILAPPVLPAGVAQEVSFANPAALRIAFAAAALTILLDFNPFVGFLFIVWSMGAGFMAVWMYRKRTGRPLSVSSGAKLGWITGVFTFGIMTVLLTTFAVLSDGKWADEIHQQMTQQMTTNWAHDPNYQQMLRTLENPATFAMAIFLVMVIFFVLLSLASVAGGALGARFSNKE
jgi:hypothetical protein